jgi:hypothetical protein
MGESDISGPTQLDTLLAAKAMHRRDKLWKQAEGRSFRWADVIAALAGGILALPGLYGIVIEQEIVAAFPLAIGLSLPGFSMLRHQQLQIDALRELVREFSRRR